MQRVPQHTDWIIWERERDSPIAKGPCHLSRHEAGAVSVTRLHLPEQLLGWSLGKPWASRFSSTLPAAQLESLAESCRQKLGTRHPELFQWPQLCIHAKPSAILDPQTGNNGTATRPQQQKSHLTRLYTHCLLKAWLRWCQCWSRALVLRGLWLKEVSSLSFTAPGSVSIPQYLSQSCANLPDFLPGLNWLLTYSLNFSF